MVKAAQKRAWLEMQVDAFIKVRATYATLAATVESILKDICKQVAPQARIDSRAKTIASFAEKALRKCDKYQAPLERMTDLAGARVVVSTLDEVRAICHRIEHEPGFRIDWDNSVDKQQQLRAEEFGYNAIHYVVELCDASIEGVPVPTEVQSVAERSLKAEIQVHTVLQNTWAIIGHDRIYKSSVKVPAALKRQLYAVAAMLESADNAFSQAVVSLDRFLRNFEAFRTPEELAERIEQWETVHKRDPRDGAVACQLSKLLMAAGRWPEAHEHLRALEQSGRTDVLVDLAEVADKLGQAGEARGYADRALKLDRTNLKALCVRGQTFRTGDANREIAASNLSHAIADYEEAFSLDPEEPCVLAPLLECQLRQDGSVEPLKMVRGSLAAALQRCAERASRGVYLPQAHYDSGRFHLYLGQPQQALEAYALAISTTHLPDRIVEELTSLTLIVDALLGGRSLTDALCRDQALAGFEWARRMMVVALAARGAAWRADLDAPGASQWVAAAQSSAVELARLATPEPQRAAMATPIVFVAGGCDPSVEQELNDNYGPLLQTAFISFSGTIISGGTTAGVSGMVGRLPATAELHRVAYLPATGELPEGDQRCEGYAIRPAPGKGYNPAGVLQAWADILLQGVRPDQVHVLGINGGSLTAFELRFGVALGAVVGVVEGSGREANTLLADRNWRSSEGIVPLPPDGATWAAFVRCGNLTETGTRLSQDQVEQAARAVHAAFRQSNLNNPAKHDPSVLDWPELPAEYRVSNYHQVRFAEFVLRAAGYQIVPLGPGERADPAKPPVPPGYHEDTGKLTMMAQLEHGRFCAERLIDGWRPGPKDLQRKLNPTLVPWEQLSPDMQEYDFSAVRAYPSWLAAAGLKVVKREAR